MNLIETQPFAIIAVTGQLVALPEEKLAISEGVGAVRTLHDCKCSSQRIITNAYFEPTANE